MAYKDRIKFWTWELKTMTLNYVKKLRNRLKTHVRHSLIQERPSRNSSVSDEGKN